MTKITNKLKSVRVVSVALAIFMLFVVFECGKQVVRIYNLNEQKAALTANYEAELERTAELTAQKELLNDPTYMERLARENLLMIREGEYLVVQAEENDDVVDYAGGSTFEDVH